MGHEMGDIVLKDIGGTLKRLCRKIDFVGRYGGEEFVLILPGISLFQGEIIANRIRKAVKQIEFIYKTRKFHVSCSIGVSCYKGKKNIEPSLLINKADEAMYRAKREGRDNVMLSEIVDIDLSTIEKMVKVNSQEKKFLFGKK